jgi:hypothetical protein
LPGASGIIDNDRQANAANSATARRNLGGKLGKLALLCIAMKSNDASIENLDEINRSLADWWLLIPSPNLQLAGNE